MPHLAPPAAGEDSAGPLSSAISTLSCSLEIAGGVSRLRADDVVGAMTRRVFAKRESLNTCRSSLLRLYQCYIFIICRRCDEVSGSARRCAPYCVGRRVAREQRATSATRARPTSGSALCLCSALASFSLAIDTNCMHEDTQWFNRNRRRRRQLPAIHASLCPLMLI